MLYLLSRQSRTQKQYAILIIITFFVETTDFIVIIKKYVYLFPGSSGTCADQTSFTRRRGVGQINNLIVFVGVMVGFPMLIIILVFLIYDWRGPNPLSKSPHDNDSIQNGSNTVDHLPPLATIWFFVIVIYAYCLWHVMLR